jgi:NADPH-dependent 7-cyano-7-deazaguanine reductase QueF
MAFVLAMVQIEYEPMKVEVEVSRLQLPTFRETEIFNGINVNRIHKL